jgi:hypothetical protein
MNWKHNKILFNYIINQKYLIKKDIETNNTLFIKWAQFEMKCKYFLAFSIDNNNEINWSCDNHYIDQKTKYLSYIVKNSSNEKKNFNVKLLNKIKYIIQSNSFTTYQDEKINFLWCLIGTYKNFKQFYIITEIVCL